MNAIEIKNLSKSYKNFTLQNISFDVPKGTIVGLVGENGAGKSTTLNILMDTIKRDSGDVKILGVDNTSAEFTPLKNDIGVVLEKNNFPEKFTVPNIQKTISKFYINWSDTDFDNYVKVFKLPIDKKISDFSTGMLMKLNLAVALSHGAKVLILDEVTSGLDPMAREKLLDILYDYSRDDEKSILLSSHIVSDLEKICDYICFIHEGKIILFEEKDKILEDYSILKVTRSTYPSIPLNAIVRKKEIYGGYELLVKRDKVSDAFTSEKSTLEDIIIFLSKEK